MRDLPAVRILLVTSRVTVFCFLVIRHHRVLLATEITTVVVADEPAVSASNETKGYQCLLRD